jgi:DNA-binding NarL/FixJ family response regulator
MASPTIHVVIVEDDPLMLATLSAIIDSADDISLSGTAVTFATGRDLIDAGGFDVLLCDLGLPDGNGIDLIRHCAALYPAADIMVITLFAEKRKVLDCIRAGARGYLHKDQDAESCVDRRSVPSSRASCCCISNRNRRPAMQSCRNANKRY